LALNLSFLLVVLGLNVGSEYLKALLNNLSPDDHEQRNVVLKEFAKVESSDLLYVLLQSLESKDLDEVNFALNKLFEIKDEELFFDIEEILPKMEVEALEALLAHMSDEDREANVRFMEHLNQELGDKKHRREKATA
jgi:phosphoribosyl-ATP pyrophosphohydrolase